MSVWQKLMPRVDAHFGRERGHHNAPPKRRQGTISSGVAPGPGVIVHTLKECCDTKAGIVVPPHNHHGTTPTPQLQARFAKPKNQCLLLHQGTKGRMGMMHWCSLHGLSWRGLVSPRHDNKRHTPNIIEIS
jgi:hypothetical protein